MARGGELGVDALPERSTMVPPRLVPAMLFLCVSSAWAQTAEVTMAGELCWLAGYSAPRLVAAGDVNGDGLADVVGLYPEGEGILDYLETSPLGKPLTMLQARRPFGSGGVAVAVGDLDGRQGAEVLALTAEGQLLVAAAFDPNTCRFGEDYVAGQLPDGMLPATGRRLLVGDFLGSGDPQALIVSSSGDLALLTIVRETTGGIRLEPTVVHGSLGTCSRIATGDVDGVERDDLVWIDETGVVSRGRLAAAADGTVSLAGIRTLGSARPYNGLAVGRFGDGPGADVVVGRWLLPRGLSSQPRYCPDLPSTSVARTDADWLVGDFDGDGRDDVLRIRRAPERFTGDDLCLHLTHEVGRAPKWTDGDRDGLLDHWERGEVRPGGLDLPALGCSSLGQDIIVEIQRFSNVDAEVVEREIARAADYYASLPTLNPGGVSGIRLHPIHRESIPEDREGEAWQTLGAEFHPERHRGVTHWMLIGSGGGGQSGQTADRGTCGVRALYATFLHEFGHQVGLDHTGHWGPAWCPTYSSLMSYSYNYQLGGDANAIRYSDGRLGSLELTEADLDETLPLSANDLAFLAGPPYRYPLRPSPDGAQTLIDWNWNGIFGESEVSADINYGYSTQAGPRHHIGKTLAAPTLVDHGGCLLVFGAEAPLEGRQGLRLTARLWEGEDPAVDGARWSEEMDIEPDDVVGDCTAVHWAGTTWIAYQTSAGIAIRPVHIDVDQVRAGDPVDIPLSAAAQSTLAAVDGRLLLLMWRDADTPVAARWLDPSDDGGVGVGDEFDLPLLSESPVGAVEGALGTLWIGLTEGQDESRPGRWQVREFAVGPGGALTEIAKEWIGGEAAQHRGDGRIVLLWEPEEGLGARGRLYFFQCGTFSETHPWSCHYFAMRVAEQDVHGGWLVRRYYDEWSQSRSGPGVAWYREDIAYAMRWQAEAAQPSCDDLIVSFFGRGIESDPMGDFDDIGFISSLGIARSKPCLGRARPL